MAQTQYERFMNTAVQMCTHDGCAVGRHRGGSMTAHDFPVFGMKRDIEQMAHEDLVGHTISSAIASNSSSPGAGMPRARKAPQRRRSRAPSDRNAIGAGSR